MAATISARACTVLRWNCWTRSALSGTTSARCSLGSWVVTPTGHWLVWQRCAWMQPTAIMKARAELHQSAPRAIDWAMADAVTILPLAPTLMRSRTPAPTSTFCTSMSPSIERGAERVGELERRGTGAALAAVDDDEVGVGVGLDHRLDDGHELAGVADAELEADRLAARELAELGDEGGHLERRRERPVVGGGEDVLPDGHEAGLGDLLGDLGAGEDAAVAGLGALRHLDLDHLDLRVGGVAGRTARDRTSPSASRQPK